jgi:superfamily II DNA or RNA helicase
MAMFITLPEVLAIEEKRRENPVRQLGQRSVVLEGALEPFSEDRLHGSLFRPIQATGPVLIVPKTRRSLDGYSHVIEATLDAHLVDHDLSKKNWLKHPLQGPGAARDRGDVLVQVARSWEGSFSYAAESPTRGVVGLRGPQLGALHAVQAHWFVSSAAATVVMPTGTGKTDTMISILVSTPCTKLLVVVPTDALRYQLARKFCTLGILRDPGNAVLRETANYPVVCTLLHIPRDAHEVDEIFEHSQVIVTTSAVAGGCTNTVQDRMAELCPYLFIDEAHHAEAPTWKRFKERFRDRKILQFTATPFREDGQLLDGNIIFNYPLKKAQDDGYFKPIAFKQVIEFNREKADAAIASAAIEQLRADASKGHILMARVDSIARAEAVFKIYEQYTEFNPVQLHTGVKSASERETRRIQVTRGESRVVVCVDMLGEGFDLPELKIAAFHDIRKSLAVTLQLAGRFTRARADLGHATFVANTADVHVKEELRKLYARDPDWNLLLPKLSSDLIDDQMSLQDFLSGFPKLAGEIPLDAVRPAMSTVAYQTDVSSWSPHKFKSGLPSLAACEQVHESTNTKKNVQVIVTARRTPLTWAETDTAFDWQWDLYVLTWSREQGLLFINSSANAGNYEALAAAVAGPGAKLLDGQSVFRSFAGVNRLCLQNVGLTEQIGKNLRYTGRMGADIEPALPDAQRRNTVKTVLSGTGFEGGESVSVGASRKGRIWSHRRGRVSELVDWCKHVGGKLLDSGIDPDEVLKGTLHAKTVSVRPAKVPFLADWPEQIYKATEDAWSIRMGSAEYKLYELDIDVVDQDSKGPLRIAISSTATRIEVELQIFSTSAGNNYKFVVQRDSTMQICKGKRPSESIADFFYNYPPKIWFSDGSSLEGNQYVELNRQAPPFDPQKIEAWDWAGTDLRKESQGELKEFDSIQARVIRELRTQTYDVIFDDDGKGEAADVVGIRVVRGPKGPTRLEVDLYHCKYSGGSLPGKRIKDLYEVCGQAQKSVRWASGPKRSELFTHLLRRASVHADNGRRDRYELGSKSALAQIRDISQQRPTKVRIFIVQPGVSKAAVSPSQLELMSVTETYLMETYQVPFGVVGSA